MTIVDIAKSYIGQREKTGNSGFNNALFEKRMRAVGWDTKQSWCSYFCELVWKEYYNGKPEIIEQLDDLFSGSATETYRHFEVRAGWIVSKKPTLGALVVWRYGIDWRGHIGIVSKIIDNNTFLSIEGNTTDKDSNSREGVTVAENKHLINKPFNPKGLNLVGFILPK